MTKRYNMKEMSWKGQTFYQITSTIQQNINNSSSNNRFLPPPLKIYRREIATPTSTNPTLIPNQRCSRTATSINELNMPNGYLVYSTIPGTNENANYSGVINTMDINSTKNISMIENYNCNIGNPTCKTSINTMSPTVNALRRLRSSGMIRNNSYYYTSNSQYLKSRNLTYNQNQYQYVSNVKVPATIDIGGINTLTNHCPTPKTPIYKPNNKQFAQQGAVSSSSLVTRLKYNTITTAGATLRTAFGANTANALAYNSSFVGYTVKDKVGYPLPKYPTFNKYSDKQSNCNNAHMRG
jgi:hypothetical protein